MKSSCLVALFLLAGPVAATADDLEDAFQNLKEAETKKDAAEVKRLAAETHALALKALAEPAPANAEEKEDWKKHIDYVKEIDSHTEYSLYAVAVQSPTPVMIDLISTLEQQNPKSKYLDNAYGPYLVALSQTDEKSKIPAIAAKALGNFPDNEDLLALLADNALAAKQFDRALTYSTRMTTALAKHAKPEGVAQADWDRHRNALLGRGYWIAGVIHADRQFWAAANKELRAALPFIQGNDAMMGPALFSLGLSNHQLGMQIRDKKQVLEAATFFEQAAKYDAYRDQAWRNATACKAAAATIR